MSAKKYQPPFTFTSPIVAAVSRISEFLGAWSARSDTTLTPMLRRGNRIQTIQASLAIEHNTLSIAQVSAVLDGKPVFGPLVAFMLDALEKALLIALAQNDGVSDEVSDGVSDGVAPMSPLKSPHKLVEVDKRLMSLMDEQPHITQDQLVERCGKSLSTIQRHIRKLRQHGLIERIGSDKSGYWKVNQ